MKTKDMKNKSRQKNRKAKTNDKSTSTKQRSESGKFGTGIDKDNKRRKTNNKKKGDTFQNKTKTQQKDRDNKSKKKNKKTQKQSERNDEDEELEIVTETENLSSNKRPTFDDDSYDSDEELRETREMTKKQNRKNKKSGGFQSMGFCYSVYKGIIRKGYKIPTPVQRKTMPVIMEGKDVVAMARTGSGKTAAFLLPLFEKLKQHSGRMGARGLILSPTRELALQTLKFVRELGKFTSLKAAVILGGDRMDDQFEALHQNPDIIIATPGRLLHVLVEMDLKFKNMEYVVFDEADRLFEMGFSEQLHEIINRLPENRQTLLFSATLPKVLADFAKAGLHDPVLIRLDVDSKLSPQLHLSYLQVNSSGKLSALLYLLRSVIPAKEQTFIFTATKHHVEYLYLLLEKAGIKCAFIYSSLDQTARRIAIGKFQNRKVNVLIVTDLAARGMDIPILDNVINFHFPAKPKLFVHRVGRVARAGRTGTAYSLVTPDEFPFLLDLHLFLGRSLNVATTGNKLTDSDGVYGRIPQALIDDYEMDLKEWEKTSVEITSMKQVCDNGYQQYIRSRPSPSAESIKRMKEMNQSSDIIGFHPLFSDHINQDLEQERTKFLDALKGYRSGMTVFELNSTRKTKASEVMKQKRSKHDFAIHQRIVTDNLNDGEQTEKRKFDDDGEDQLSSSTNKKRKHGIDEENYLSYRPSDYQTEKGFGVTNTFDKQTDDAVLDIVGDDSSVLKKSVQHMRWDRKKKKFVGTSGDESKKKIRTESGAYIPASYKSSLYKEWKERSKIDEMDGTGRGRGDDKLTVLGTKGKRWHTAGAEGIADLSKRQKKSKFKTSEIKRPEQILKARKQREKKENFLKKATMKNQKRKSFSQQMSKKKN